MALLLAIYFFLLLIAEEGYSLTELLKPGALVAFNPYVIYAHAGYAEPAYFALSAAALYFLGRHRWVASGATAGILSATGLNGFYSPSPTARRPFASF